MTQTTMKYYRQLDLDFRGTFYRPDKPTLLVFLFFPNGGQKASL
jgi:hypothetical protein